MDIVDIKVSVIVPVFNVDKYVGKCIESILRQTHRNLEVILIDDGSTDSSGIICDHYAEMDSRIKVLHGDNKGVSSARNSGIDIATGDYICFVDADDYVAPDYVEYLLGLVTRYKADIGYSENIFTAENEKQIKRDRVKILTGEEAAIEQLCYKTNIGVWNKIFRTSFLGKEIRFIPEQYFGEGFNFNVTAFQRASRVVVGRRKIYYYRQDNNQSATKQFSKKKWINGLKSIDDIRDNFMINTRKIEVAWRFARWRTNTDLYIIMVLNGADKIYPDMFYSCKKIAQRDAIYAFRTNASLKEKISALIFFIYPRMIFLKIYLKNLLLKMEKPSGKQNL